MGNVRAIAMNRVVTMDWAAPLATLMLVSSISCNEELPSYADPRDLFDATLEVAYAYTHLENALKVYILVRNDFDETFDAIAILKGRLVIVLQSDPSFRRTVNLEPSHLVYARHYNPATGVLRVDPGDSVRIGFTWNFLDDNGVHLRTKLSYSPDPTCQARLVSGLVNLNISGDVKMYERTEPTLASPILYQFHHNREWVDPRNCFPLVQSNP
jgi:hypothetical protein